MKRILSVLCILLLVFGLFAGCGKKEEVNGTASGGDVTANLELSKETVTFKNENGESKYRIVRPDNDITNAGAQYIFKQLKNITGSSVRSVSDAEDGTDLYEIIVGECDRPETKFAKMYLEDNVAGRYNDYIICTIGKKIVVYGQSVEANTAAAQHFVKTYLEKGTVEGGILYTYGVEGEFETVTVNGIDVGKFDIVRPHYNTSYLTVTEIGKVIEDVYARTGYMMNELHDTYTADSPSRYEIIVGNTSREGVETVADKDTYKITFKGNKVYINGGSAHATALGVAEFGKMLKGALTDAASVSGSYTDKIKTYDAATTLRKTWGDDFDGDSLDTKIWLQPDDMSEEGLNGRTSVRSTNPKDVFVKDGKFHINARYDDYYYYGGYITTREHLNYKYGYAEISAKIPHGIGFWTAFWTGTTEYASSINPQSPLLLRPEIDIMECFGNSVSYAANMHRWPSREGSAAGYKHTSLDISQAIINDKKFTSVDDGVVLGHDFHTYGFYWDMTKMDFMCDGEIFFSREINTDEGDMECFNHSMYFILSLSVGGANDVGGQITDNPDDWANTNKFIVDYINVYQYDDGLSQLTYSELPIPLPY
ncbi:MAG: glycoside hydrolase family 16 protein [Clostridia bacterium]|nr:glycoside hydrolase family 16 protein [Clostridia bacterium]